MLDGTRPTLGMLSSSRDALSTHGVLCIRQPAPLGDPAARALVSMFGHVKDPVGRTADGRSLRYGEDRQIIDAGFVMTDEMRAVLGDTSYGGDEVRPGLFEFFHTDDSYTERPASVTVLHARELPRSGGGDTCFLDMRAAFEILDRDERDRIVGLHAVHAYNNEGAFPPRARGLGGSRSIGRGRTPDRARAPGHGSAGALLRPRPRQAHRGAADRTRTCAAARFAGSRRAARTAVRPCLARSRRAHLGQRGGAAQGQQRLPRRRAKTLLALHGRGIAPPRRRVQSTCRGRTSSSGL